MYNMNTHRSLYFLSFLLLNGFGLVRSFCTLQPQNNILTASYDLRYAIKKSITLLACEGEPCKDNGFFEKQTFLPASPPFLSRRRALSGLSNSFLFSFLSPLKSNASTKDPKSGILFPSEGEIEAAIPTSWDDTTNPYNEGSGISQSATSSSSSNSMFSRLDKSPDSIFYKDPRFVEHVDENAVKSMTNYISSSEVLTPNASVLDLCSSWTSHIDVSTKEKLELKRVAGLGMNAEELQKNPVLTDYVVQDLNANPSPKFPYESESFDVVLCQLSIDYLIHPVQVMQEISRVLKPGGKVVILFSNRLFFSKAVGLWTGADDIDHAYIVGSYLHYSFANFQNIQAKDLSTRKGRGKDRPIQGDPLYSVTAIKGIL